MPAPTRKSLTEKIKEIEALKKAMTSSTGKSNKSSSAQAGEKKEDTVGNFLVGKNEPKRKGYAIKGGAILSEIGIGIPFLIDNPNVLGVLGATAAALVGSLAGRGVYNGSEYLIKKSKNRSKK